MKQTDTIGGQQFLEMFAAATDWLEKSAADIDALNVFPVPDGDTGTNMLLTMKSTIEHGFQNANDDVSSVARSMANGALMGARGNSGVILSQFWTGLAQGLGNKETINGKDFAEALGQASIVAYKGVSNPVEGTIGSQYPHASPCTERSRSRRLGGTGALHYTGRRIALPARRIGINAVPETADNRQQCFHNPGNYRIACKN
jgi:hypothetical protein